MSRLTTILAERERRAKALVREWPAVERRVRDRVSALEREAPGLVRRAEAAVERLHDALGVA